MMSKGLLISNAGKSSLPTEAYYVGFKVLMAMSIKMAAFWVVMQ
jgi:hypothetical protein